MAQKKYDNRAGQERRARAMLARCLPFSQWRDDERPTIERANLWLTVVGKLTALAALTTDEARSVRIALELNEATAFMETKNDRA
jgi:hypothetical protein